MDRRTILTLGFILALIVGAFAFLIFNGSAKQAMQKSLEQSVSQAAKESGLDKKQSAKLAGQYLAYSEESVSNAKGTKLIFFHAPWCPQCRDLEKDIKKQGVPEGVTIFKTDYDTSQDLRQKYGVTIQTTIVRIDENGNLVKKYVAYDDPTLDSVIKNTL